MQFFKFFSLLSIAVTSAIAAAPPMEKRYPIPVAAPQPQPAPVANLHVKRQENSTSQLADEIEAAVPKIKDLLANGNLNLGGIIGDIEHILNGSLVVNAVHVINAASELLDGDAPKVGNQLLTSKLLDVLGKQSTYDTLLPLLHNAKPLLSKEFITNTVHLVNNIAGIIEALAKILKDFGL
ncbi:hypothetical protein KEM54_000392 [Ascosphaera aggregata]|nr:hypothetical protein KEM54_000392 [Ascosphaera aggregata]